MPRKPKKLSPAEEAANAQALDAQAGVERIHHRTGEVEDVRTPLPLTYNTREKLLLKCAQEGFTDEFFKEFTDRKELLDLTCMLGIRRLAVILVCRDAEVADVKDAIAVMRVVLNMVYGENATTDIGKFVPPPAAAQIPVGAADGIDATMEKMKKFGAK